MHYFLRIYHVLNYKLSAFQWIHTLGVWIGKIGDFFGRLRYSQGIAADLDWAGKKDEESLSNICRQSWLTLYNYTQLLLM
jgi:hypothetical protein